MSTSEQPPVAPTSAAASSTSTSAVAEPPRIIKRYSNRKLYDTVESRYVTLPQIAELVRKGEDVRIIDNNSKEDLTSVTLAQILYEEERKQSRALPLAALKDLIHTSITSLRESPVGKFIAKAPDGSDAKPGEPSATGAGHATADPVALAAVAAANAASAHAAKEAPGRLYEIYEQSRGSIQEWQHRVDERVRKVLESISPVSQIEKLQGEVRKLSQRLEELEAKLAQKDRSTKG